MQRIRIPLFRCLWNLISFTRCSAQPGLFKGEPLFDDDVNDQLRKGRLYKLCNSVKTNFIKSLVTSINGLRKLPLAAVIVNVILWFKSEFNILIFSSLLNRGLVYSFHLVKLQKFKPKFKWINQVKRRPKFQNEWVVSFLSDCFIVVLYFSFFSCSKFHIIIIFISFSFCFVCVISKSFFFIQQ